jgi:beta-galactosidase
MTEFRIGDEHFELDGRPFRILSGALHYFRVHPDQWRDRIRKAKQMGLNTIETYVAWNAHSPREDAFDLSGGLDLGRFLDEIAAEGMYAIVRPGPYICAEWDNGGLPAWLFRSGTVGVRRREPQYMAAVERYLRAVGEVIVPRQIDRGGPILLVQIENEYGAYGSDADYLEALVEITRSSGVTVPLTTVDQPTPEMLEAGSMPGLHKTASFGSRSPERLATLRAHQPTGPLLCAEYWDGWFDSWGEHHHTTSAEESARDLADLLSTGASVNLYMFHGGTNFGFTNGANDKGVYRPLVTSYDYDAPLDETGAPTAKYFAYREVLARYADVPAEVPAARPLAPAFSVPLVETVPLGDVVDQLGQWHASDHPPTMDELGAYSGFALYRARLDAARGAEAARRALFVDDVRDRALVSVDGEPVGVLSREHHDTALALPTGAVVELLVEDQGRVNYGERIGEAKGLVGRAYFDDHPLVGWETLPLDLSSLEPIRAALRESPTAGALAGPAFARAIFTLDEPEDLFLDSRRWGKGVAWVNGFCLGRYWTRGPQHTLFVPGSALRAGDNELLIFELHAGVARADFVAEPDLGHTEA